MKFLLLFAVISVVVCAALAVQSECQKRREEALKHETIMMLIPNCKPNGDYEEIQCDKDGKYCVCSDKNGKHVTPGMHNLKDCGCYLEIQRKMESIHGYDFLPQCEEDGTWTPKQCNYLNGSCWCVDKSGKQVGDIKHEGQGLDC